MPRVSLQTGCAQQPQHAGTKPDWGNPLTAGLKMLTSFGNVRAGGGAVDAVTNTPWTPSGTTAISNLQKGGKVVQFTGGSNGQLQNVASLATLLGTADHTILLLASITDTSRNSVLVSGNATSGAYCNSNNGKWSYNDAATNSTTVTTGKIDVVFFLQAGGNKQVVQNNNYSATAASAAAGFSAGNTSLGNYGLNGGFTPGGTIALFAVWKRVLSQAEISELTSNPWQLFKSQARDVGHMMRALGAPGASTYNLDISEAGIAVDAPNRDGSSAYSVAISESGASIESVSQVSVLSAAAVEALSGSDSVNTGSPPTVTLKQHWYQPVSVGNAGMMLTFGTNPMTATSGSTLIAVWTGSDNQSMPPPTDNAGTFTVPTGGIISAAGTNNIWLGMAHQANAAGGSHTMTPHTVNVGGNGELGIWIFEVLNMPATPTIRGVYSQSTTTSVSTWTVTSDSAPVAGDFAICAATYENTVSFNPSDLSDPPSGGWTSSGHEEQNGDVFIPTTVAYQVVPSSGAISATWSTSDPTVSEHLAMILVMAPLTAGGGGSTYNVTASESGTAADAPGAIETASVTQAEAGAAVDAPSAAWTTGAAIAEGGAALDAPSASAATSTAVAESGAGADISASALVAPQTIAEAGTAADAPSASLAASAAVAEAGTSADAPDAAQSAAVAIAEAGTAVDTSDTSAAAALVLAEGGDLTDTPAGALVTAQALTEIGAAADATSAAAATSALVDESGIALDAPSAAASVTYATTESLTAADTLSQIGGAIVLLAETLASLDATSAQASFIPSIVEALAAGDTPSDMVVMLAGLVDAGVAVDVVVQGAIITAAVIEAGTLADAVSALRAVGDGVAEALLASDATGLSAVFVAAALESGSVTDIVLAAAVLGVALAEAAAAHDVTDGTSGSGTQVDEELAGLDAVNWIDIAFGLLRTFIFRVYARDYRFSTYARIAVFQRPRRVFKFPAYPRLFNFTTD